MSDRYAQLVGSLPGRLLARNTGLPQPARLERYETGAPLINGEVLLGSAPGGRLTIPAARVLAQAGTAAATELRDDLRAAAAASGLDAAPFNPAAPGSSSFKALLFDASAVATIEDLATLHAFAHGSVGMLEPCGRLIVLAGEEHESTAQRALEGYVRSAAKELGGGGTAQLLRVAAGAEGTIDSTLRFLLSPRSAYVSGQVIRLTATARKPVAPDDWGRPLHGTVALVTGASRGIGGAIAETLARDGAHVLGVDVPALADELEARTAALGGSSLALDITEVDSSERITAELRQRFGGIDIVVHNAGITRDRRIARMTVQRFVEVLEVNLAAPQRINESLLEQDLLHEGGRIIGVSSISGIAGNSGQANYATSKAGVIGMVQQLTPRLEDLHATANAVAPGFIETQMTAAVPFAIREAGRRMNSLTQGGLPIDVAETIAWLAAPSSGAVKGNIVRVCGQSLLGA